MLFSQFVSSLSSRALIVSLTSSILIVYDNNQLKAIFGFTDIRSDVEYNKEVKLLLSTEIPIMAEICELVVSKNGDYVILEGPRSLFVARIGIDVFLAKPDSLPTECFCECYPLHDSLLLQNSALTVKKSRILSGKCDEKTIIAAALYSDNCIRFYNLQKKVDSFLLCVDFRHLLHLDQDKNVSNNTFGLQKTIVSFDFIAPQPKTSHFSLIAVDSEAEFYGSFVHFSCFKEGSPPRIHRLQAVDGLPCDPLDLQYIETSNPRIASVFVLVSGGGILSHLVVFPNEYGEFQLMVYDQLRLPPSCGDPIIIKNQIRNFNINKYFIATSLTLLSVSILPWFGPLSSGSCVSSNQGSRVYLLASAIRSLEDRERYARYDGARPLRAISVQLESGAIEEVLSESEDVMHLVILENNEGPPLHVVRIESFECTIWDLEFKVKANPYADSDQTSVRRSKPLDDQICSMKPLPACVISDKVSCEEAIEAALKYFDAADDRLRKYAILSKYALDEFFKLSSRTHEVFKKLRNVDQRIIEVTKNSESLKVEMNTTRERIDVVRKNAINLFHRLEENVPLSENEIRIVERLREHQKMLSNMSVSIPKVKLDTNELLRTADKMRRSFGFYKPPDKFIAVATNETVVESLEARMTKLSNAVSEYINLIVS